MWLELTTELPYKRLYAAAPEAYQWPREVSDEEVLARLLRLNGERTGKG